MTSATASARIDTAKVLTRRSLEFRTVEEAVQDIDRIEAADQFGKLQLLGNWTAGQSLGHVAAWINYAYEGFPIGPPPWFVRVVLRWMLPGYLRRGMPAGKSIPGVEGGTVGCERLSTAEGAARLRRALRRLVSNEPARYDSPAFGSLSHDDRVRLNLRHAELHLSFLVPPSGDTV